MLIIILNWIYILFTAFCMGYGFSVFVEKVLHYRIKRVDSILMTGLVIATAYAQIFSIFYRVNIEANVVMLVVCAVICVTMRKRMAAFIKTTFSECSLFCKICIPLLFLVWSYFTSRGYRVPDMDMYHGQSIRWIEEYGVVKGLGNLHQRFAYNSSIFAVSALYSMKFLLGRSLHTVNGFITFLLSLEALNLRKCFSRKKMLLSDFARVGMIYYMTTIWDEIIAPSSDYAVMLTIFFIIIKWLTQLEDEGEEKNITPYALLCVAGAYTLTLKLTAGLILIVIIKPAYRLLKEKRWKEILIYLALGLTAAVPWMVRTVLISGWLFYPFPALDLFRFDWKMTDIGAIRTDAELIKVWAKGTNEMGINVPLKIWYPHWFSTQLLTTEKILIVGDMISVLLTGGFWVMTVVKKRWKNLDELLVLTTVMCCFLFWQFSAPMMRYGYAHVLLLAALTVGYILRGLKAVKLLYVFLILFGIYKLYTGAAYIYLAGNLRNL